MSIIRTTPSKRKLTLSRTSIKLLADAGLNPAFIPLQAGASNSGCPNPPHHDERPPAPPPPPGPPPSPQQPGN